MNENIKNTQTIAKGYNKNSVFVKYSSTFLISILRVCQQTNVLMTVSSDVKSYFVATETSSYIWGSLRTSISLVTTQNRRFSFSCLTARTFFSAHRVLWIDWLFFFEHVSDIFEPNLYFDPAPNLKITSANLLNKSQIIMNYSVIFISASFILGSSRYFKYNCGVFINLLFRNEIGIVLLSIPEDFRRKIYFQILLTTSCNSWRLISIFNDASVQVERLKMSWSTKEFSSPQHVKNFINFKKKSNSLSINEIYLNSPS